jgi:hypothetical protein
MSYYFPSPQTNGLTSGRLIGSKGFGAAPAPWRPAWCHGVRPAVVERGAGATRRRRGGRKGALFFLSKETTEVFFTTDNGTWQEVSPDFLSC